MTQSISEKLILLADEYFRAHEGRGIKEAKETDIVPTAQTFGFTMTAAISPTPSPDDAPKAQPAGAKPLPEPAAKGRS